MGTADARFSTRIVTTAGMTRSTTGAYDATGATDVVGAATAVAGRPGPAALTPASGALQAANVTTASAAAASPPFLK